MEEDVEEADAEMDVGEAPPTGASAPEEAPAPPATMLATAGIWGGWSKWPGGRAGHQLEGSGKGTHRTGGVAAHG